MLWLVAYVLLIVALAGGMWLGWRGLHLLTVMERPAWLRRAPDPSVPPIQRLAADLTRLSDTLKSVEASNAPAKARRLIAVGMAYDDTLCLCCTALELEIPGAPPLDSSVRLQTEAELASRGLVW